MWQHTLLRAIASKIVISNNIEPVIAPNNQRQMSEITNNNPKRLHAHDASHEFIQVAAAAETKRQVTSVIDPAACTVTIPL
jgi:hypothetical protein